MPDPTPMTWEEWVSKVAQILKEADMHNAETYAKEFRGYFNDGYSPKDAVQEDFSYAD